MSGSCAVVRLQLLSTPLTSSRRRYGRNARNQVDKFAHSRHRRPSPARADDGVTAIELDLRPVPMLAARAKRGEQSCERIS
jgi:hypothetical protein